MLRPKWGLCASIFLLTLFPTPGFLATPKFHFGMLVATSGENRVTVCASYVFPSKQLPNSEKDAPSELLMDLTRMSTCRSENNALHYYTYGLNYSVIAIDWPNCSLVEVAEIAQSYRGRGIVAVSTSVLTMLPSAAEFKANNISISASVISKNSFKKIKALGENVFVKSYIPPQGFYMDFAMVVSWIISMICVTLGTFWVQIDERLNGNKTETYDLSENKAGEDQKSQMTVAVKKEQIPLSTTGKPEAPIKNGTAIDSHEPLTAAEINVLVRRSILKIVIIIIVLTSLLISLYFFYDVAVYISMALFALIGFAGTFFCLITFKFLIPCSFSFKIRNREIEWRSILIALMSIGLVVTWIVLRHESYGWLFQDIMVMFALVRVVSHIEFYNLKHSLIITLLFFLYNTFMAFGTPPLTPDNKSVLVALAVGGLQADGTYKEHVPMSLSIPGITNDPYAVCIPRSVVLSLVDIALPGCVINCCYKFGKKIGFVPSLVYFFGGLAGHGVGLFFTFLAMLLLKHGQPALLYVVPTQLLVITVVSLVRKEFNGFWTGVPKVAKQSLGEDVKDVNFLPPSEEEKMISSV